MQISRVTTWNHCNDAFNCQNILTADGVDYTSIGKKAEA